MTNLIGKVNLKVCQVQFQVKIALKIIKKRYKKANKKKNKTNLTNKGISLLKDCN